MYQGHKTAIQTIGFDYPRVWDLLIVTMVIKIPITSSLLHKLSNIYKQHMLCIVCADRGKGTKDTILAENKNIYYYKNIKTA